MQIEIERVKRCDWGAQILVFGADERRTGVCSVDVDPEIGVLLCELRDACEIVDGAGTRAAEGDGEVERLEAFGAAGFDCAAEGGGGDTVV